MEGGDLRHHLSCKTFTEVQSSIFIKYVEFFIACMILGL
jgi:hypothetical protein